MPLYYNWFQFNGVVQGASLKSLVHPHRVTHLNYYLQVTASLFHGVSFSQIIKSLCQCLSKWYFSLTVDMRENSSQWDMEFWREKVLGSISPSWQKLKPLHPLSPGFLTLPSVLTVTGSVAAALWSSRKGWEIEGTQALPALSRQAGASTHYSASCYMKSK